MRRERARKIVLVLVGLLFSAGVHPLIGSLLRPADSDTGDTMMLSLYVALGIFLLENLSSNESTLAKKAQPYLADLSTAGVAASSEKSGAKVSCAGY